MKRKKTTLQDIAASQKLSRESANKLDLFWFFSRRLNRIGKNKTLATFLSADFFFLAPCLVSPHKPKIS